MGELRSFYCDVCGKAMASAPFKVYLVEKLSENASPIIIGGYSACPACRTVVTTFFETKQTAADEQWILTEPVITPPEMPI